MPSVTADPELLRLLLAVHRHLDLDEQLREMLRGAVAWSGVPAGWAYVAERDASLPLRLVETIHPSVPAPFPVAPTAEPLKAWADRELLVFEGLGPLADPAAPPAGAPGAGLLLPVRAERGEPAGLLVLWSPDPPADGVRDRLRLLVREAQPAVANALQVLAVRQLIILDDTAACYNRRYFNDFIVEELARATRFRTPLSLIFFDMDNLKQVNSQLGHSMGSRTLWEVSARVRGRIRKFDKLFRFGGDEFCIVLPETEWHGALEVAERVRSSLAGEPFLATEPEGRGGIRMSASFGIASFPLHARAWSELVQRADRAMQTIKNGPKNSIAIAEIDREEHGR